MRLILQLVSTSQPFHLFRLRFYESSILLAMALMVGMLLPRQSNTTLSTPPLEKNQHQVTTPSTAVVPLQLLVPATVGDYTWLDCNQDGIQDPDEGPMPFVPITLFGINGIGTPVNISTVSDENGFYSFEDIKPGNYTLFFGFPAGVFGIDYSPDYQTSPDLDSDVIESGLTTDYTLVSDQLLLDVDAGFVDISPPQLLNLPSDITIACEAVSTLSNDVIGTDNLTSNIAVSYSEQEIAGNCLNNFTLIRTWTATDDCGNTTEASQTVTVIDEEAPILAGVPADLSVTCTDIPDPVTPTAEEVACEGSVSISLAEEIIAGDCLNSYQLIRTWTATDPCGNVSSQSQTITISDGEAPIIIGVPDDITVDCEGIPSLANPVATDNCTAAVNIDFSEQTLTGDCADGYQIIRIWTATDECGNTSEEVQTITVLDNVAPAFESLPTDATVDCNSIPAVPSLTATDDCSASVNIDFSEQVNEGDCTDGYSLVRTWIATDDCGNMTEVVQTITIIDLEAPTLIGVPSNVEIDTALGEVIPEPANVVANDNCDTDVEIVFLETIEEGECQTFITYTWIATDNCGNSSEETQVITLASEDLNFSSSLVEVSILENELNCVSLASCFNSQSTSYQLLDNTLTGSSDFGNWSLSEEGCMLYSANAVPGNFVDTICVIATYNNVQDTTCYIYSIMSAPLSEPEMDTLFMSTLENTALDTCLSLVELDGAFASNELWFDLLNNTGSITLDNGTPCFTYLPNPSETGNFIDTVGIIICDDLGTCDTTVIIFSVEPQSCPNVLSLEADTVNIMECFGFAQYCLDINPNNIFAYGITDNGLNYNLGFAACDFDSSLLYATDIILLQAPVGPYRLDNWTENGISHSITTFFTLQELVDSMNVWNPAGNWFLTPGDKISGGEAFDVYSSLEISQIPFPFNEFTINLSTIEVPNGTIIAIDTGFHEIIINEFSTGCQDTLLITVNCDMIICPDLYTGPSEIPVEDCDSLANVCLSIPVEDLLDYSITDNGNFYTDGFLGCDFDTTVAYLTAGFNLPELYALDSWQVNANTFSLAGFNSTQELIDSMNVWDPQGNWVLQGLLITGGDPNNIYGNIIISQNGAVIATANPNTELIPNGFSVQLPVGSHELILTNTANGCIDTVEVEITCQPIIGGSIDTLVTIFENSTDTFCVDISGITTISSMVNLCEEDSNGNVDFSFIDGTACVEYTAQVYGLDTFCIEICDVNLNLCDTTNLVIEVLPVADTIELALLLGFSDTICLTDTTYFATDISTLFNACPIQEGPNVDFILDDDSNCVEIMAIQTGLDTLCLVNCDMSGFCDTTVIFIEAIPQEPDVVVTDILVGATPDTLCLDTTELAGTIISIENICPQLGGSFIDFDVLDELCVSYEGLVPNGTDTACIVICDEFGFCDTTTLIVNALEDANIPPPIAVDDSTSVVAGTVINIPIILNDTLGSTLTNIGIVDPPGNGTVVINSDFTITYLPDPGYCGEVDYFSYYITTLGGTDTATVAISILCEELLIYSGISPNGDGVNDTFIILGIEKFVSNTVYVFNRWGNQIFKKENYSNLDPWDGTWEGKHLADGTYFYVVEVVDENGEVRKRSGYLQVHR